MELVFTSEDEYARETHDTQEALETELGALYACEDNVRLTPSGIAAIAAVLYGFKHAHANGQVWTLDEVYNETQQLLERFDYKVAPSIEALEQSLCGPALIFVESCSNPHGRLPDFERLSALRDRTDECYLVVDNTWLSAAVLNPFRCGADLVVLSLTKYYSGGGAIMGAVLSQRCVLFLHIADWITDTGQHVSPYDCQRVLERLGSLRDRIARASQRTHRLLEACAARNIAAWHPFVQQREQAQKLFERSDGELLLPSVVLVDESNVSPHLRERTSYGGKEDRFERYGKQTRVALGYESTTEAADLLG